MIKVQLCPVQELENPYWYVGDLICFVLVAAISWGGVEYYLGGMRQQTASLQEQTAQHTSAFNTLQESLARYRLLDQDIAELNRKIDALKSITVSPMTKMKPIIVLEHLQTIKPAGVWFTEVNFTDDHNLSIKGAALNNILIAELMLAFRETELQEPSASDLRSLVAFSNVIVEKTAKAPSVDPDFPDIEGATTFSLKLTVIEKKAPTTGDAASLIMSQHPSSTSQRKASGG